MGSARRERSRSPMIAPVAARSSASVRTRRRSLDASSVAYSSDHGFGPGTAVDISSDVESSNCSSFEERFDSSSSNQSHRAQLDVPYADSLWNSPCLLLILQVMFRTLNHLSLQGPSPVRLAVFGAALLMVPQQSWSVMASRVVIFVAGIDSFWCLISLYLLPCGFCGVS